MLGTDNRQSNKCDEQGDNCLSSGWRELKGVNSMEVLGVHWMWARSHPLKGRTLLNGSKQGNEALLRSDLH